MLFRTHLTFAIFSGLLILEFVKVPNRWSFFALLFVGVLFPDVDHKESFINKRIPFLKVFAYLLRHRGIMHSVFPPLVISMLIFYFTSLSYSTAFFTGYLSHLIADALTISGVNFLYPISTLRIRGPVRTGSVIETIFFLVLAAACILLIAY